MFRQILVAIHDGPSSRAALSNAVQFASSYGSHINALFVRPPPPLRYPPLGDPATPSYGSPWSDGEFEQLLEEHDARQTMRCDRIRRAFESECREASVPGAFFTVTGDVVTEIVGHAQAMDLVVVGRSGGDRSDHVAHALVRKVGHPILVAPAPVRPIRRIAVAYDGSFPADRALALAADVATSWKSGPVEVDVISVSASDESESERTTRAADYLDAYGVKFRVHTVVDGKLDQAIVDTANGRESDLLVMGAYGHSRMREILLGSTTERVLDSWTGPVLLTR